MLLTAELKTFDFRTNFVYNLFLILHKHQIAIYQLLASYIILLAINNLQ